jgi:hypothetical protein
VLLVNDDVCTSSSYNAMLDDCVYVAFHFRGDLALMFCGSREHFPFLSRAS